VVVDASDRTNDSFGYSVYAVVAFAPRSRAAAVEKLRREIDMKRAALPAHVTIKGTFCDIEDFDAVRRSVVGITERSAPAQVDFADDGSPHFTESFGGMLVSLTPQLTALNAALEEAIGPISTNAYTDEPFRPHLTLCQDCSAVQIEQAKRLAGELDLGTGFLGASIDLVGRVGPAYGGRWESIEHFPLRA